MYIFVNKWTYALRFCFQLEVNIIFETIMPTDVNWTQKNIIKVFLPILNNLKMLRDRDIYGTKSIFVLFGDHLENIIRNLKFCYMLLYATIGSFIIFTKIGDHFKLNITLKQYQNNLFR